MAFSLMTVIMEVATYAADKDKQDKLDRRLNKINSELDKLQTAVTEIRDIIKGVVVDNRIEVENGKIMAARKLFDDGFAAGDKEDQKRALEAIYGVTSNLRSGDEIQLQGAITFEVAASLHISMLRKQNDTEEMAKMCLEYQGHLEHVITEMRRQAATRISLDRGTTSSASGFQFVHVYKIDGTAQAKSKTPTTFSNRTIYDTHRLTADYTIPLALAAKDWRAASGGYSPTYGEVLDGSKFGLDPMLGPALNSPGRPTSLACPGKDGRQYRLRLAGGYRFREFSTYGVTVAEHIYLWGQERAYSWREGAQVYSSVHRNPIVEARKAGAPDKKGFLTFQSDTYYNPHVMPPLKVISVDEYNQMLRDDGIGVHLTSLHDLIEGIPLPG